MRIRIEVTFRTLLTYCVCLSFFLLTNVGHTKNQTTNNLKLCQEYFKDILLVICYNHPYYETIEFEKSLYSPVFKNIVFYGDRTEHLDADEFNHHEDGDRGDVRIVYTRNGYYLQKVVADVLRRHPSYAGYIFMQDDVLMQFWRFLSLDKNKIWFGQNSLGKINNDSCFNQILTNRIDALNYDWWFNTTAGIPEIKKLLPQLSQKEKAMLATNFGENTLPGHPSDFFYIPKRFSEQTIRLCDLFSRVFVEIATPTMLGCMDYMTNWEELLPHYWTFYDNLSDRLFKTYRPDFFWLHSCKFSIKGNRDFARRIFNEQFYDPLEND